MPVQSPPASYTHVCAGQRIGCTCARPSPMVCSCVAALFLFLNEILTGKKKYQNYYREASRWKREKRNRVWRSCESYRPQWERRIIKDVGCMCWLGESSFSTCVGWRHYDQGGCWIQTNPNTYLLLRYGSEKWIVMFYSDYTLKWCYFWYIGLNKVCSQH